MVELLNPGTGWLVGVGLLVGLLVGSLLNVVVYRLPLMLQREWHSQCSKWLDIEPTGPEPAPATARFEIFNLARPASHCPRCHYPIKPWHNIPVLGYLLLHGRCASCNGSISPRYPVVELLTGLLSGCIILHFGVNWLTLAVLLFSWCLMVLTLIDLQHQLLPDQLTIPLLWLGLLVNALSPGLGVSAADAVVGAMAGYLSLWGFYWLFRILTGKEGMGYGDFKLLAALGAWLGWQSLLPIIILSSVAGSVVGIGMMVMAGRDRAAPMPFGPYLALAGFIMLVWGSRLEAWYGTTILGQGSLWYGWQGC